MAIQPIQSNKLIQFNSPTDKNVFTCIDTFLKRVGQNSENTKVLYERSIRDFFLIMRNKRVEDLVEKDLIFTKEQVENYQVNLKDSGLASGTVNVKMSALKKCYSKLEDYGFNVRATWFDLDRYNESDKKSYSPMTKEEVIQCMELVKPTREGEQKALLIRLAFATAFRKESLLHLKWSDISDHKGEWVIKTLGKGQKWDYKKITNELYEDLQTYKEKKGYTNNDTIFSISVKTVERMMNLIRENIDFGDRNIVFHSFKKSSINEVAILTNYDLKAMQRQGNHANVTTTLNDYMETKKIDDLIAVDTNDSYDITRLQTLSAEELYQLILKSDRTSQIRLLQLLDDQEGK